MKEVLQTISTALNTAGINYEFGEWSAETVKYPYWIGEYTEIEPMTEDGYREIDFILTGTNRGGKLALENDREKIEKLFPAIEGSIFKTSNGRLIIFYAGALVVPVDDGELDRLQINLTIKRWKV